jgi:hypothetical protein
VGSWKAETSFAKVAKGTILTIMYTPSVVGHAPPTLTAGEDIRITYAAGTGATATVVDASEDEITLELSDQSRWKLTPRSDRDRPFGGVDTGIIPSQDWIVRSAA